MSAPTVVNMRGMLAQKRVVLIGNMIRLASTIERGTTWGGPQPLAVAKREGWTIKSASKERALVDMVETAQREFGYRLESGTTLSKAYGSAKAEIAAKKAAKKSKKLV